MAIDICVCTFRRESLASTLLSLDQQHVDGHCMRVIVVDNDDTPSAQVQVEDLQARMQTPIKYVHAPARNISIARNAALETATAEWVAFIDDDEVAPEGWLSDLIATAERESLDIVFGPTVGQYEEDDPAWIRNKDYHSFMPYERFGQVETGSSGNALIRYSHPAFEAERFLLDKGRTGGEDTEFFNRIRSKGARVGMSDTAALYEPVAKNRLSFSWIAKRKFRSGVSYGRHVAIGRTPFSRVWVVASAMSKICLSGLFAGATFFSQTQRNFWALRSVFHTGVLSAALGRRETELY